MRISANKILGLIVAAALAFGLAPGGLVAYGNDAKDASCLSQTRSSGTALGCLPYERAS